MLQCRTVGTPGCHAKPHTRCPPHVETTIFPVPGFQGTVPSWVMTAEPDSHSYVQNHTVYMGNVEERPYKKGKGDVCRAMRLCLPWSSS